MHEEADSDWKFTQLNCGNRKIRRTVKVR